jgi:hypothetical protein
MAVTVLGLFEAIQNTGDSPTGEKVYTLQSDTQITDDISLILNAAGVPAYDDTWSADDFSNGDNLRVRRKRARTLDDQEGFIWQVQVNYESPTVQSGQEALDPADRDWDWSKGPDKRQIALAQALFTATGHKYPGSAPANNVIISSGKTVQNTAKTPIVGLFRNISRQIITLTKYINSPSDLGVGSYSALDAFVDTVNSDSKQILGITYPKWTLLMDDISYGPISENGYDRVKVQFRIIVDTYFTHVQSVVSAGYKQLKGGKLVAIPDDNGGVRTEPAPLDKDGLAIAQTAGQTDSVFINVGANDAVAWASLSFPSSIP